jgi:hypothetical protein
MASSNGGQLRTWPSPPFGQAAGLSASWPWGRMQVSRRRPGRPPGRVGLALGAPELGAATMRMRSGMRTPVAEVSALLIRGRGRRRRLALLRGLAEAAAAVPGDAKPATNARLIESWCGYQPKHDSQGGHHQQPSRHGHPLPACCRAVTRPESPIGVPTGATARIAAHSPGRARGEEGTHWRLHRLERPVACARGMGRAAHDCGSQQPIAACRHGSSPNQRG